MRSKFKNNEIQDRASEIFLEILEQCGVWSIQDNSDGELDPRTKMVEALYSLCDALESLPQDKSRNEGTSGLDKALLSIEETAQRVSLHSKDLARDTHDFDNALELCVELSDICRTARETQRYYPLVLSLSSAIKGRRHRFCECLREVDQRLMELYEYCNDVRLSDEMILSLKNTAIALRNRCVDAEQFPWKEAKEVVLDLVASEDIDDSRIPEMKHPDEMEIASKSPTVTRGVFDRMVPSREDIALDEENIILVTLAFLSGQATSSSNKCILLVGSEGSGKTVCLDQIEELASGKVNVIRPSLPFDAMGGKVGGAEDMLISVVAHTLGINGKAILLLDDIESICGDNTEEFSSAATGVEPSVQKGGAGEPHLAARVRALLLSLIEVVNHDTRGQKIIICTARSNWSRSVDRFDQTFVLENPKSDAREQLFRDFMSKLPEGGPSGVTQEDVMSNLVECTGGLSYSTLAFHCREAILEIKRASSGSLDFLHAVKHQLQQAVPDSLKAGASAEFGDMKVFTIQDLQRNGYGVSSELSLFGESIDSAWDELKRLIVTPICHANVLHEMMFHSGGSSGRSFAGGVLLTGGPGSGKSTLAYECAALAASLNPSVKLVDVSCTSLIHKQVGSSEQAIHRLFQIAKSSAPCILLMDGIENVAAVRGNDNTTEGTMDRVLSTLLTELDGVDSEHFSEDDPACLAIIGITHAAHWIDPALRRPGRLERVIELGMPAFEARQKIAERQLDLVPTLGFGSSDKSALSAGLFVAEHTEGFSGAAVVGVCNEAKMLASKEILKNALFETVEYSVSMQNLQEAIVAQKAGKSSS